MPVNGRKSLYYRFFFSIMIKYTSKFDYFCHIHTFSPVVIINDLENNQSETVPGLKLN